MKETTKNNMEAKGFNNDGKGQLRFLPFAPERARYFESINTIWIDEMFVLEDIDKKVLQNPQKHIMDKGGFIYFVEHETLGIIGTCALLNSGNGNFELTKMGVHPSSRGLKVGEQLLQYVIEQAQTVVPNVLYLLTNKKCEAAIHLYEKNGFCHDAEIMQIYGKSYARCDVAMRFCGD
jgi:ribosomal protein S18 acetylase RimI-like enzyme